MFKKLFHKSPKNEEKTSRDPYFKSNNVTTITKTTNFPHHSSSHSPFRNDKNETISQVSYQNSTNNTFKQNTASTSNFTNKQPEKNLKPVYETPFKPAPMNSSDLKESFSNMMGSISEHTQEGNKLVQNLPNSKDVYASKIPISDFNNQKLFKIVNKDTGYFFSINQTYFFRRNF